MLEIADRDMEHRFFRVSRYHGGVIQYGVCGVGDAHRPEIAFLAAEVAGTGQFAACSHDGDPIVAGRQCDGEIAVGIGARLEPVWGGR